jgi:NAD(P)-dependent dehydrogenase (short-subunit alcohol dehydrogenase family)
VISTKDIKAAFATAVEKFGRIDVVVNNAGYTIMGDTEGSVDEDARKVMDANFWGVVDVSKEAVRVFREVNPKGRGGTVLQITSMGGWVAFPGNAFYHARSVVLSTL